jgi:hypothetical protein
MLGLGHVLRLSVPEDVVPMLSVFFVHLMTSDLVTIRSNVLYSLFELVSMVFGRYILEVCHRDGRRPNRETAEGLEPLDHCC